MENDRQIKQLYINQNHNCLFLYKTRQFIGSSQMDNFLSCL